MTFIRIWRWYARRYGLWAGLASALALRRQLEGRQ